MPNGAELVGLDSLANDGKRLTARGGPLESALAESAQSAVEPVAAAVRSALPRQSGDLAGSVSVGKTRTGGKVRMGDGLAYAGPVDFGGYPGDREYIASGRYLFPTAERMLASAGESAYAKGTQHALDAYPWTQAR